MGKDDQQPDLRRGGAFAAAYGATSSAPLILFCNRCSARASRELSLRCVAVLVVSLFLLVSGIFLILRPSSPKLLPDGYFDVSDAIKLSAPVHAYFQLQMPVSELLPQIGRLEYDIFSEIGLPDTKVIILSMHPTGASNYTGVVFGVLPDPLIVPINPVSLSVLRSSTVDLFLKESNLTLTNSTLGRPSTFEILKFPGGVTVIQDHYSILQLPRVFFNFTLNNSISEIWDNLYQLQVQLKSGLFLRPYETVFLQITNMDGSTVAPPVVVQASVVSNFGSLLPQRLRQLAETITESPAKNLGLDNSLFGKVKGVILSSYLEGTLDGNAPIPLPAPSPRHGGCVEPPLHPGLPLSAPAPSSPSPSINLHPHPIRKRGYHASLPPSSSPHHLAPVPHSPYPCQRSNRRCSPGSLVPHSKPVPQFPPSHSPHPSPLPGASYGSRQVGSVSPSVAPSPIAESPACKFHGLFCCDFMYQVVMKHPPHTGTLHGEHWHYKTLLRCNAHFIAHATPVP